MLTMAFLAGSRGSAPTAPPASRFRNLLSHLTACLCGQRRSGRLQPAQSSQQHLSDRLAARDLHLPLACMRGQLRRHPEQPVARPVGLGTTPAPSTAGCTGSADFDSDRLVRRCEKVREHGRGWARGDEAVNLRRPRVQGRQAAGLQPRWITRPRARCGRARGTDVLAVAGVIRFRAMHGNTNLLEAAADGD